MSIALPPLNGGQPAAGETQLGQTLIDSSLETAVSLVAKMKMLDSGAEAKDFAAAVLDLAQVVTLLDPTRDEKGVPLDHELSLQKQAGEQELEKVKASASAQAGAPKKKLTVKRDGDGRAASYEEG